MDAPVIILLCLFVQIWDLAGQDHYRAMTRTYYKGASGCLVVYDITNRRSFEQAKAWKQDLDQKVYLPNSEILPCILVANKVNAFILNFLSHLRKKGGGEALVQCAGNP